MREHRSWLTTLSRVDPPVKPHPCFERDKVCSLVSLTTLILSKGRPAGHPDVFELVKQGGEVLE